MRMSLRRTSSALCSVALAIVEPASRTGASVATGVTAPVRPTCRAMPVSTVVSLLRRELEGDRPPRELRRVPRRVAQRELVSSLMTTPSVSKVELPARLAPSIAEGDTRIEALEPFPMRLDGNAHALNWRRDISCVCRSRHVADHLVGPEAQAASRDEPRIQIAHGPGGRVSSGWRTAARPLFPFPIHAVEGLSGQVHSHRAPRSRPPARPAARAAPRGWLGRLTSRLRRALHRRASRRAPAGRPHRSAPC